MTGQVLHPCRQIERFQPGLLANVPDRDANGGLVREAGVMAAVRRAGVVQTGDTIVVQLPPPPHHASEPV
jgi:MOSC domain-containing protein YiiM